MPVRAKVPRKLLQPSFARRLVHDHDSALRVSVLVHTTQKLVKTATKLFEGVLHNIFIFEIGFLDHNSEERPFALYAANSRKRMSEMDAPLLSMTQTTPELSSRLHFVRVEFEVT